VRWLGERPWPDRAPPWPDGVLQDLHHATIDAGAVDRAEWCCCADLLSPPADPKPEPALEHEPRLVVCAVQVQGGDWAPEPTRYLLVMTPRLHRL
jgi:hypothetical protein